MDFRFTEEQLAVRDAARDFARTELAPGVIDRDVHQHFPDDLRQKMGDMGFMGMMTSPNHGGGGMDTVSYVLAVEEIARIDASAAVIMSVNNSLVCWGLEKFGTEDQKSRFLTPVASGRISGAFCLSEPEAGSDATQQHTSAEDRGDHYLLNGTKNWITNGSSAGIYLVMAQTDASRRHKGINCLVVEKGQAGFVIGKKEDKMGIRGSDTHSLMFQDVNVPKTSRIGDEGAGFTFAMSTLNGGRIGIAAQAVGIAAGALDLALRYAQERKAFGKPLCEHQAIQFKLAQMAMKTDAARLMVLQAAWLKDQGLDFIKEAAMAKLYASTIAQEVTTEAVQIHGGYGYVREFHVERMMRDAKITEIYEGTSEIQHLVIARELLR